MDVLGSREVTGISVGRFPFAYWVCHGCSQFGLQWMWVGVLRCACTSLEQFGWFPKSPVPHALTEICRARGLPRRAPESGGERGLLVRRGNHRSPLRSRVRPLRPLTPPPRPCSNGRNLEPHPSDPKSVLPIAKTTTLFVHETDSYRAAPDPRAREGGADPYSIAVSAREAANLRPTAAPLMDPQGGCQVLRDMRGSEHGVDERKEAVDLAGTRGGRDPCREREMGGG